MLKINELTENTPLKVVEVTNHVEFDVFLDPKPISGKIEKKETEIEEYKRIQIKIFTDGEISKIGEDQIEEIDEYYIGKKKYQYDVDTLKYIWYFFKNHNYVITYTIASEPMKIGNIHGWFDIIKDVSIYLKDVKDKNALREAKKIIKAIRNHNNSVNYSSLLEMTLSSREGISKYDYEKIIDNVYSFKKSSWIKWTFFDV